MGAVWVKVAPAYVMVTSRVVGLVAVAEGTTR
jgi:hypothetical protein